MQNVRLGSLADMSARIRDVRFAPNSGHAERRACMSAKCQVADNAARKRGWRPAGRAAWLKADGTTVLFVCFEEQLAALPAGVRVHVVGRQKPAA
jgi:hypothetical protein